MADEKEDKIKGLAGANTERRFVEVPIAAETRGAEERVITGYALKFNTLSNLIGGWFKEKINRDALNECDMSDVIACFNHDINTILGRTRSGTLTLKVDDVGLYFEIKCPNTSYGNDLWESVTRGDVDKCSFMFVTEESVWETLDGVDVRTILKVKKLYDVSLVVWPAYEDTEAAKRSLEQYKSKGDGPDDLKAWQEKRGKQLRKMSVY